MTAYICFGRWNNFKSKLIRWITDSNWSHVWIEYPSEMWGRRMIVHADSKGVIVESVDNFWKRRGTPTHVASFKVNSGDVAEGFKKSAHYLGKDYGYLALIWNALMLVLMKIGFKKRWLRVARDLNRYTCSEFVILFLKNARARGADRLDAEATWPGKLARFLNDQQRGQTYPIKEPPYIRVIYEK